MADASCANSRLFASLQKRHPEFWNACGTDGNAYSHAIGCMKWSLYPTFVYSPPAQRHLDPLRGPTKVYPYYSVHDNEQGQTYCPSLV
eukprot:COSAG02_NODE_4108_length_5768_cov_66.257717_5_plen_88_part_00